MHQLTVARISSLALAALLTGAPAAAQSPQPVTVLYAASLVTPMEGPVARELRAEDVEFNGEPGGSKKLANLIAAGARTPDVFICVDPAILTGLGASVASSTTFARTALGIAWSPKTHYAQVLATLNASKANVWDVLSTPGLRIGRTDPRLDPKGAYTLQAVKALAGARESALLGDDANPQQIFPEEDLLARVETGEIDAGFFYRTEAIARGYQFYPLPPGSGTEIRYALGVMKDAPHPDAAKRFADFILHGRGRALLEQAGLEYLTPPGIR
ncbi:MAG: extracellular solute-binding protein [Candidatus Eremiobacteraeota bacterium]|nr:extracellular solute-binding protein [Candidatus Eremiobacteraeota bacterium]